MGELAPLRPILADILAGLGMVESGRHLTTGGPAFEHGMRLLDGAATLRWAHDFDEGPSYGEREELERLRGFVRGVEDILDAKSVHPGHRLKDVAALLADVD